MKKPILVIVAVVVLLSAFAAGRFLYRDSRANKLSFLAQSNAELFVRFHSVALGPEEAPVYLVEFFDPGCETCSEIAGPVKQLLAMHPGKIRLVLRYAPFHHGADDMVKILEAARLQGRYWETLQVMFDTQPYWASHHNPQPELIWQFLPRAGLDLEKVRADMTSPAIAALLAQDLADARALQVRKTPTFFVNGKPLTSFGFPQLRELVESELDARK